MTRSKVTVKVMQVRKVVTLYSGYHHCLAMCSAFRMLCDTDNPSSSQTADHPLSTASSVTDTSDVLPMVTTASAADAENTFDAASPQLQELLSSLYSNGKLYWTTA